MKNRFNQKINLSHDTKISIGTISIKKGCNMYIVRKMHNELYNFFYPSEIFLVDNQTQLDFHMGGFWKNQSSIDNVYALLFDESEEGSVEVSPDFYKLGLIRKILPGSPK